MFFAKKQHNLEKFDSKKLHIHEKNNILVVFDNPQKISQYEKKAKEGFCLPIFRQLRKKFSLIDM